MTGYREAIPKFYVIFTRAPRAAHGTYLGGRTGTTTVRKNADRFENFEAAQEKVHELRREAKWPGYSYEVRHIEIPGVKS